MILEPQQQPGFPRCVSLSIEFNPHAVLYQSAVEWLEHDGEVYQWVSSDERERALATNSVWVCQWYPDTPVGFYLMAAASFSALMAAVNEVGAQETGA